MKPKDFYKALIPEQFFIPNYVKDLEKSLYNLKILILYIFFNSINTFYFYLNILGMV